MTSTQVDRSNGLKVKAGEIKNLRTTLKLSQEQFAQLLKVSLKTIIRWEKNWSTPSGFNLRIVKDLIALVSNNDQRREAVLRVLSSRDEFAPSDLFDAIHAAVIIQGPETKVYEIIQKFFDMPQHQD